MAQGRKTGGRQAGTPNRATVEDKSTVTEAARQHTEAAIAVLVEIATSGASETARVSAASALLDRGYGRPAQAVAFGSSPWPSHEECLAQLEALR